jgi:hypothetical protein
VASVCDRSGAGVEVAGASAITGFVAAGSGVVAGAAVIAKQARQIREKVKAKRDIYFIIILLDEETYPIG